MHDSLIATSGQLPSFRGALTGLVAGTLLMMAAPRVHDAIPIYITYPLGVVMAIGGTVFLVTQIRCPQCRTRIIWDALRQHPGELQEALYRGSCRRCGHVPGAASRHEPQTSQNSEKESEGSAGSAVDSRT